MYFWNEPSGIASAWIDSVIHLRIVASMNKKALTQARVVATCGCAMGVERVPQDFGSRSFLFGIITGVTHSAMPALRSGLRPALLVHLVAAVAGSCTITRVVESSRSWKEVRDGKDHFQLLMQVPEPWRPFAHFMMEWTDQVQIISAQGASLVKKSGVR